MPHANRSSQTPCLIESSAGLKTVTLNQREETNRPDGFHTIGVYEFDAAKKGSVTLSTKGANGNVHVDCVQLVPAN